MKFIKTINEYINFNDMYFYHGSDKFFTKFDRKYTSDGNIGDGFYFTPVIGLAQKYGDIIYKVKLNIKNPIYLNGIDTEFTNEDIEYIIKNIPDNLFNGRKDEKDDFLNMILSINNNRIRNIEFIKSITFIDNRDINIFQIMGYDSIIEKDFDELIVWDSNLIEIIK